MKAIVQDRYGDAEVLEFREIEAPVVGDDDVLVRVRAAGVDPSVLHLMTGLPYLVRVLHLGLRAPRIRIRGRDVAGCVEAVGRNVSRFRPGDEVFGTCNGSFAEYVCTREDVLAPKPTNLTFEQAAAVPISGLTALNGLRNAGSVQAGQQVLLIGASGGVGTFAVQIAKAYGAEVTGVCSARNVDLVRSIGADHVIDYTHSDCTDGTREYDLILEMGGNRTLTLLRRALAPRGTLVLVGGEAGGKWLGGLDRQIVRAPLLSLFVTQTLRPLAFKERGEDLVALTELIESGKVAPIIDTVYPLDQTPKAIEYLKNGHARGKIVVTI
jgi:NADPH:quinone reductase-like Zn-dependent oxidoreductase